MELILEILNANVALLVPMLLAIVVVLLGKAAAKSDTAIDDKIVELIKKNEKDISDKAIKLVKEKIDQAIARKKKK